MGDIGDLWVQAVYLYRYSNLPASITLTEDQKLQFEDVKFLVSPYHALNQESTYKFAKLLYPSPYPASTTPTEPGRAPPRSTTAQAASSPSRG